MCESAPLSPQRAAQRILTVQRILTNLFPPSTKIAEIVRRLRRALDLGQKTIVFSQWTEVLELIVRACADNGIAAVQGWGSRFQVEVNRFKTSPAANVLLLPMSKGAQGLNLTEAQNVLLVEPCIDTGLELQAISRVHRIGQTKETLVVRFIILDSVEEQVLRLSRQKLAAATESAARQSPRKGHAGAAHDEMQRVTVGELEALFKLKRSHAPGTQMGGADRDDGAATAFPNTRFWSERVLLRGHECSRDEAYARLSAGAPRSIA